MVREGVLVTERQAAEHDARRELPSYAATDADYDTARAELAAKWGFDPPPADVLWRLGNEALLELGRRQDWQGLRVVTSTMALQAYREGRNHFGLLQDSQRYELLELQRLCKNVELVSGLAGNCCHNECGHCSPKKQVMPIAVALEKMPIPRKDCGYHPSKKHREGQPGWCVCSYSAVFPWEEKGASR